MTLANALTISRLVLALVFFILFQFDSTLMRDLALATMILAGLSDILDGYIARAQQSLTTFGRIADAFVDKVLICGAFIFLIGQTDPDAHVRAWMVVVIVGREFLVNGLRTFAESRGVRFRATILGKSKMFTQFVTICWIVLYLGHLVGHAWAEVVTIILVWATVILTAVTGAIYVYLAAARGLLERNTTGAS
ncbi:MAG: CDP-alcohol phosphatidyltransferase family protein [Planctomycetota bacterium]